MSRSSCWSDEDDALAAPQLLLDNWERSDLRERTELAAEAADRMDAMDAVADATLPVMVHSRDVVRDFVRLGRRGVCGAVALRPGPEPKNHESCSAARAGAVALGWFGSITRQ